ncbi:hypothetical protein AWZ03_015305, partial [Drosophila navojoa]
TPGNPAASRQGARRVARAITPCCTCPELVIDSDVVPLQPLAAGQRTSTQQKGSRKGRRYRAVSRSTREITPLLSTLNKAVSILLTAIITLQTEAKAFNVKALIDSCIPTTQIQASLARTMGLSVTSVGPGEVCTAFIRAKTSKFSHEALLQMDPQLNCRTPIRPIERAASPAGITLADSNWTQPSSVFVVLDSDVYPHVILPGIVPSTDGR